MSKTKFYRQCRLTKSVGLGTIWEQVSFIPEEFAFVGQVLKLKDDKGEWVDGWEVASTGQKMDAAYVERNERQHTWTRGHSDI